MNMLPSKCPVCDVDTIVNQMEWKVEDAHLCAKCYANVSLDDLAEYLDYELEDPVEEDK